MEKEKTSPGQQGNRPKAIAIAEVWGILLTSAGVFITAILALVPAMTKDIAGPELDKLVFSTCMIVVIAVSALCAVQYLIIENLRSRNRKLRYRAKIPQLVSHDFSNLEFARTEFDAAILSIVRSAPRRILRDGQDQAPICEEIDAHRRKMLEQICDTASRVLAIDKGLQGHQVCCNVKLLRGLQAAPQYKVEGRSRSSSLQRKVLDDTREKNGRYDYAKRNYYYSKILRDSLQCFPVSDIVDVLEKVKAENEERNEEDKFNEPFDGPPGRGTQYFYKSCLVFPITTQDLQQPILKREPYQPFGKGWIMGFICVDSVLANRFSSDEESFDFQVLRQLSLLSANIIRISVVARELVFSINSKRSRTGSAQDQYLQLGGRSNE